MKFNNLGIFQSLKLPKFMGKILRISPRLNFNPNTLGCYGLRWYGGRGSFAGRGPFPRIPGVVEVRGVRGVPGTSFSSSSSDHEIVRWGIFNGTGTGLETTPLAVVAEFSGVPFIVSPTSGGLSLRLLLVSSRGVVACLRRRCLHVCSDRRLRLN